MPTKNPPSESICVIGIGYIGLPTATFLATKGYQVVGVDIDHDRVQRINECRLTIDEPDLDLLLRSAVHSGNFVAQDSPGPADIYIIAVPTPKSPENTPNLEHVHHAIDSIIPYIRPGALVILESTCPVGTTESIYSRIVDRRPELRDGDRPLFSLANCPERVLPGQILLEMVRNHRVVGGINSESTERATAFYRSVIQGGVWPTDSRTAEMCKLVENTYRDVNIAFANEISMIAAANSIDAHELIRLANLHPRVDVLSPGTGVGGHCIAVDPWFLIHSAGDDAPLLRAARGVNRRKTEWVVDQIEQSLASLVEPTIVCLGLSYKPDVADTRESPALEIYRRLKHVFRDIAFCDPHVGLNSDVQKVSLEHAVSDFDVIIPLVAHEPFLSIDPDLLKGKTVIDPCGILS